MELRIRKLEIVSTISVLVGLINIALKLWLPNGLTPPPAGPHQPPPLTQGIKVS